MNTNHLTTFFDSEIKTAALLVLSQLTGFIFSPLGLIAPYFIWLTFKGRYSMVDHYSREIINFSIHLLPLVIISIVLVTLNPLYIATIAIPVIVNLVFNIICLVKISKGQKFHFPYTFKIIRGL